jgi:hypothetical protein
MMQVRQVRKGVGFPHKSIGGISQTALSTAETIQQLEEFNEMRVFIIDGFLQSSLLTSLLTLEEPSATVSTS